MTEVRLHDTCATLLGLALFLSGCTDGSESSTAAQDPFDDSMEIIAGGIGAALLAGTFGGGYQAATIRIGFDDYSLSSYQGEFSFDSDVFELVDVRTPESDFHIVNDRELDSGHMRFAGFATDGFKQAIEIELRFATDRPITEADFELSMDIAASKLGEPLPEHRILVHRDLFDERVR